MSSIEKRYFFDEGLAQKAVDWMNSGIVVFTEDAWIGKEFHLMPWQEQIVRDIYGWRSIEDGSKRYKTIFVDVPKKLGKSYFAAGMILYETFGQGKLGQVSYSLATTREQANNIFTPVQDICRYSPHLSPYVHDGTIKLHRNKVIFTLEDPSTMRVVGSGTYTAVACDTRNLSLDGIRPTAVMAVDELHLFTLEHEKLFQVIKNNMQNRASQNALLLYTTTAGSRDEGPFQTVYKLGKKVLEDPEFQPSFYPFILEADPKKIDDEEEWKRVNPGLGDGPDSIKSLSAMRDLYNQAKLAPSGMSWWKRTNLNIITDDWTSFFNLELWDRGAEKWSAKLEVDLKSEPFWIGCDFARTTDLNAVARCWQVNGLFIAQVMFWLPEAKVEDDRDKAPYEQWRDDGWVQICRGNTADHHAIRDHIRFLCDSGPYQEIDYDPACQYLVQDLVEEGYNCIEVLQNQVTISPALKWFEMQVLNGQFVHDGNPCLRWNAGNVKVDSNRNENLYPAKNKASGRIDGIFAILNAASRMMPQQRDEEEPEIITCYDNREVREL